MVQVFRTALAAALVLAAGTAVAQDGVPPQTSQPQFLGIDLDNGAVYYNGRNTGRYCLYKTVQVFNTRTGYIENRRQRTCGRGLYL